MSIIITQIIAVILGYILGVVVLIRNKKEHSRLATYFVYADILLSSAILIYTAALIFRNSYTYIDVLSKLVAGFAISYAYRMAYTIKVGPRKLIDNILIYSPIVMFTIDAFIILNAPVLHRNDIFSITTGLAPAYFTAAINFVYGIVIVGILISSFLDIRKADPQAAWKPFFIALGLLVISLLDSLPNIFPKSYTARIIGSLGNIIGYAIVSIKLFEKAPNMEEKESIPPSQNINK